MFSITAEQLQRITPAAAGVDQWAVCINNATTLYGLAFDVDVLIDFLAQACHESAGLTRLQESLLYSAERLVQVWPKRFPTVAAATPYAGSSHKLASFVYADRMGNGDASTYDGWTYRGRGLFMITGRDNYRMVGKLIGDPLLISCPDRLCQKDTAAMASAAWWASRPELTRLAIDDPTDDDAADFISISRIVNGGAIGLASRERYRAAWRAALKSV